MLFPYTTLLRSLPEWTRTTFFDINAQAGRQPAIEERAAYYRGLLVDRFKLVAHVERREMDVYVLTLARSDGRLGPNLRRSDVNCDAAIEAARTRSLAGERPEPPAPGVRPTCGAVGGGASLTGDAVQLTILIGMLAGALGRPVVDNTGLTGRFDIDFRAAPPQAGPGVAGPGLPECPPPSPPAGVHFGWRPVLGGAPSKGPATNPSELPPKNCDGG